MATALVGFSSCQKCTDCSCTYTDAFEFVDDFDAVSEASIRDAYTTSASANYPQNLKEICEKKSDFEPAVKAYEDESVIFTDGGSPDGLDWSYTGTYTCTCEE